MPFLKEKYDIPDNVLEELRSKFLKEIKSSPEEASNYHPEDIARVRENDWYIARYLLHQEFNVDAAFKMLKESLKFRNDLEVNTIKEEDLPAYYFTERTLQIYNRDKLNHPVLVIRAKLHFKKNEDIRKHQQYMLYWLEKAVRLNDWGGVSVLFDCTDASYRNMDLDMTRFILNLFKQHYPWCMHMFMVYNMPWYLSTIWKLIKSWIPEKHSSRVVFVDSKSIQQYISEDQLPVCMGGTCTDLYDSKCVPVEKSKGWF